MKKLLSITLAVAMIMSLFCVVSASAEDYADFKLPYGFTDFEDGKTVFTSSTGKYTSEVVDSGVAARGKVAQITVSGAENGGPSMSTSAGAIKTPISIGDKITVSMWIKSNVTLTKGNFSIIITGMTDRVTAGTMTASSYNCWSFPFDKTKTDWQYVSTTLISTFATDETTAFSYRMGDTGGLNFKTGETKDSETITDRVYQIDDFEIKIEKADTVTKKAYPYAENIAVTDSESETGLSAANLVTGDTSGMIAGTPEDPAPSGNSYFRINHANPADSGNIAINISLKSNLKSNHIYLVSFKTRGLDLSYPSTSTPYKQIVYQFKYGQKNAGTANTPNAGATSGTITGNYIYKNFYKYNTNQNATDGSFFGDWYTMTFPVVSDSLNVIEDLSTSSTISIPFWLTGQNRKGVGKFDFDDIQVLDLGPMSNGGFDYTAGSAYLKNGGGASTNTRGIGWLFDSGIKNWGTITGSSAYTFLQGGSRLPNEQTADKYGVLYGQYTADAQMYKYVPMMAGEKYEIKGYVRGQVSDQGSGVATKGRARLIVDYTGETLDNEVYNVKALGTNGVIYGDWVEFDEAYDMNAPMTVTVDLTNLGLIEGKTETAGIMPRTAKLIVDFDEDWEGNVNAPNTIDHTVYMDGFAMTRFASNGTPTVVANSATMDSNGIVTADYTYATEGNVAAATDASVYRLVANDKYYGTFYDKNAIVVPEAAREVEGLSLEILPISATGYYGDAVTVAIEAAAPAIVGITLTQAEGSVTVATDTALTAAKLIFVTYDANGKMVDWESVDVTLAAQATQAYAPAALTAGSYTRAMLWQDMTKCIPLADMIQY